MLVGGRNINEPGQDWLAVGGLLDLLTSALFQQWCEMTFVRRIEMLHDHDSRKGNRQRSQKLGQSNQATSRRTNSDQVIAPGVGRGYLRRLGGPLGHIFTPRGVCSIVRGIRRKIRLTTLGKNDRGGSLSVPALF